ncbi:MAG TPA: copper amine oxidase N-terminal domain-containing protein [Clostridia bacterium]
MNKLAIGLLLVVSFVFVQSAYADNSVVEKPAYKIIIEGKQQNIKEVPVTLNDRTLLPLRELMGKLGVTNDEEHIIWNEGLKSITIKNDSKTIKLKIGDRKASVDGVETTLDTSPIIYKDRTYIPLRFVAQSMGKKVVWDDNTNTILINSTTQFDRISEIIKKRDQVMKSLNYKYTTNEDMSVGDNKTLCITEVKVDSKKNIDYSLIKFTDMKGASDTTETYGANGFLYIKAENEKWKKEKTVPGNDGDDNYANILNAGLTQRVDESQKIIILEGDVGLSVVANAEDDPGYKAHTVIKLDMDTYKILETHTESHSSSVVDKKETKVIQKSDTKYDYNDKIEITLPADLPK